MLRSLRTMTFELKDSYRKNRGDVHGLLFGHYPEFVLNPRLKSLEGEIIVFAFHDVIPERFEAQLRYIKDNGYQVLANAEALYDALRGMRPIEPGSVLLTFDDGAATLYTAVFPLLKQYGFRAVSFLVPTFVGQPRFCTWDQIKEMHDSGLVDFQSHSLFHRFAPKWPHVVGCLGMPAGMHQTQLYPTMEEDYRRAREIIEQQLPGKVVRHLCYPDYDGTPESVAASKAAGYASNFWGVIPGHRTNRSGDDPFHIVRVLDDYLRCLPGSKRESLLAVATRRARDYGKQMMRRILFGRNGRPAMLQQTAPTK